MSQSLGLLLLFSLGEEVERLSLSSVSSTLRAFIEGSTLGEFHTRLSMLLGFHCHLLLLPRQPGKGHYTIHADHNTVFFNMAKTVLHHPYCADMKGSF